MFLKPFCRWIVNWFIWMLVEQNTAEHSWHLQSGKWKCNKILFAEWFLGIKRKQIKYLEIGTASVLLLMLNIDMNPFLKCQISSVNALVDVEIWVRNLRFDFKFFKFFTVSVHIFLFLIGRMWQNALKFISKYNFYGKCPLSIWMEQRGSDEQKANSVLECRDKVSR